MPAGTGRAWSGRIRPNLHLGLAIYALAFTMVALGFLTGHARTDLTGLAFLAILLWGAAMYGFTLVSAWREISVSIEGDVLRVKARYGGLGRSVHERTWTIGRGEVVKLRERWVLGIPGVWLYDGSGQVLTSFRRFLEEDEHERMVAAILEWGGQPSSGGETVAEGASR